MLLIVLIVIECSSLISYGVGILGTGKEPVVLHSARGTVGSV